MLKPYAGVRARGQRSGRAAYQFSKHWIGSQQLKAL
ncbi:ATP-binding protein [Acinetobacter baumannii]|nr:ATP-binding protein [Acinetobacter baumannii]UTB62048.1 ATP-binding protein [Acinetobacter baumannii]